MNVKHNYVCGHSNIITRSPVHRLCCTFAEAVWQQTRVVQNPHSLSLTAKAIVPVDLTAGPRPSFSESMLTEHGALYTVKRARSSGNPWRSLSRFVESLSDPGPHSRQGLATHSAPGTLRRLRPNKKYLEILWSRLAKLVSVRDTNLCLRLPP